MKDTASPPSPSTPDPLTVTLWYAKHGFHVLPLHTVDDGECTCGSPNCPSPGKHPIGSLVPHGLNDATTDPQTITQWFALWPDLNPGLRTGAVSGIVVLDIDTSDDTPEECDGLISLATLQDRYERLPDTWAVQTGGGGLHLYFHHPGTDIRNSASKLAPGLDIRGDGGYVVAPFALHPSGARYSWDADGHPRTRRMANMPNWLLARAIADRPTYTRHAPPIPERITDGTRNTTLASFAGTMRRRGASHDAILAAIDIENTLRCDPPLTALEVAAIARSVARYSPEAAR